MDLDPNRNYAKERALIEEVKAQLARGRNCQVFAVYTNKHDVIERLGGCFGTRIRAATLRASISTHKREAWCREHLRPGIDVAICHSKIVETGLDLLDFPTILFHETGYSLHTLRQSSRRSWRIGQRRPVEVSSLPIPEPCRSLSSPDGQEAPGRIGHRGQVCLGRVAGHRWRRHADGDGAGTGGKQGNRGEC